MRMLGIYDKCTCKQGKKQKSLFHSLNDEIQKVLLENVKQATLQDFLKYGCM